MHVRRACISMICISRQVTGLNCEAPINQPLHKLFVARSGVDLPLKLYKAKAAAGQRFKVLVDVSFICESYENCAHNWCLTVVAADTCFGAMLHSLFHSDKYAL